jgi:hypothetical protein
MSTAPTFFSSAPKSTIFLFALILLGFSGPTYASTNVYAGNPSLIEVYQSSNGLAYTQIGTGATFILTAPASVSFTGAFTASESRYTSSNADIVPDGMGISVGTDQHGIEAWGHGVIFYLYRAGDWNPLATHVISESDIGASNAEFVFATETLSAGTYWVGTANYGEPDLSQQKALFLECEYLIANADYQAVQPVAQNLSLISSVTSLVGSATGTLTATSSAGSAASGKTVTFVIKQGSTTKETKTATCNASGVATVSVGGSSYSAGSYTATASIPSFTSGGTTYTAATSGSVTWTVAASTITPTISISNSTITWGQYPTVNVQFAVPAGSVSDLNGVRESFGSADMIITGTTSPSATVMSWQIFFCGHKVSPRCSQRRFM